MQETSWGLEVTASGSVAGICLSSSRASLTLRHALREVPEQPAAVQLTGPAPGARTYATAQARPLGTRKCERRHVGGAGAQVAWGSLSR